MHDPAAGNAITARLNFAKSNIRIAGTLALDYFADRDDLAVAYKSSRQDAVTAADRAVEKQLREAIAATYPDDGLIGEEFGTKAGSSRYQWALDPIDGTGCFVHGLRSWSIVIALLHDGVPVLGLILEPCTGRLYWARQGVGAYCDATPISVDRTTPFTAGITAVGASTPDHGPMIGGIVAGLLQNGGGFMRNGSAALALAHVAAGHYVGYYEPALSAWDCLAGLLIVCEAGGVTDSWIDTDGFAGRKPCFASAPQVEAEIRAIVAANGGPLSGRRGHAPARATRD